MKPLKSITLGQLLRETTERYADLPAAKCGGRVLTYRALDDRSDAVAKALLAMGFAHGSHIAVWATDRIETLVCLLGVVKIGAVAVLPNTSLKHMEMQALLSYAEVDCLLYGEGYKDVSFPEIVAALDLPRLKACIQIEGDVGAFDAFVRAGETVPDGMLEASKASVTPDDPAVMLFTSGTVGASKGVLSSHYSRVNSGIQQAEDLGASSSDIFLVAIPMFHCFSLSANIFAAISSGACLYFPENRRTKTLLHAIAAERCTVFHAVPTLFSAILARDDFDTYDLSSLRIGLIGGASSSRDQMLAFRESFGFELLPSLGLTEATAGITVASPDDPLLVKLTTVGHFMDHIEGCILSPETGRTVPVGEVGEICVRGYCVMQGYHRLTNETLRAIDENGFLHTGDLGFLDTRGDLHYAGRLKELIIRGGENIFPGEIESCIADDPRVENVRVIGVPDVHYGEELCACVAAKNVTADEVRERVSKALAYYKVPKYVLLFDTLPCGESGKVLLGALRELAITKLKEEGHEV